jgi:hypothetical protein
MKNFVLLLFLLKFFSLDSFSQEKSNDDIRKEIAKIPADISDWYNTGISVKKGDFILLDVSGVVSIGPYAGRVDGAGNEVNPFLVFYSRYKEIPHAALICRNDDTLIVSKTKHALQNSNALNLPSSELDFLTDHFIGNLFISKSDQELRFIINDTKVIDNSGSFYVSIKIYHNFHESKADYLKIRNCDNSKARIDDVIIYRTNGIIIHSGVVRKVDKNGMVTEIESKWAQGGRFSTPPDGDQITKKYGHNWEIYHTDRAEGPLRNMLATSDFGEYVTDKGNKIKTPWFYLQQYLVTDVIAPLDLKNKPVQILRDYSDLLSIFYPDLDFDLFSEMTDYGYNCHGYTFTGGDGWIEDGLPVERILFDNEYCRIFSNQP